MASWITERDAIEITYKLPAHMVKNPDREWHGYVKAVWMVGDTIAIYKVASREYQGEEEEVLAEWVISKEPLPRHP